MSQPNPALVMGLVLASLIGGCERDSSGNSSASDWSNAASDCQSLASSYQDAFSRAKEAKDDAKMKSIENIVRTKMLKIISSIPPLRVTSVDLPFQIIGVKPVEALDINGWDGGLDLSVPVDIDVNKAITPDTPIECKVQDANGVTISSKQITMADLFGYAEDLPRIQEKRRIILNINWQMSASEAAIDHIALSKGLP